MCQEVRVRGEPPVQAAADLLGVLRFPALQASVPDLLDTDDVTDSPANYGASQAGHRADPQVTVHKGRAREKNIARGYISLGNERSVCGMRARFRGSGL